METNPMTGSGDTGQAEANEFSGSSSAPQADTSFDFNGTAGTADQATGTRDRAQNAVSSARNKLVGALEAGADRLRERGQGGATLAGATADGSVAVEGGRAAEISGKVAGGMQATADWLRDADVQGMKTGIERQVKEHPGRTLLIAAGLGYLLGRAFRQ